MTEEAIAHFLEMTEASRNLGRSGVEGSLAALIRDINALLRRKRTPKNERHLANAHLQLLTVKADSASRKELFNFIPAYRYWIKYVEPHDSDLAYRGRLSLANLLRIVGRHEESIGLLVSLLSTRQIVPRHYLLLARACAEASYEGGFRFYSEICAREVFAGRRTDAHFNICSVVEVNARGYLALGKAEQAVHWTESYKGTEAGESRLWPAILKITEAESHFRIGNREGALASFQSGLQLSRCFNLTRQLRRCHRLSQEYDVNPSLTANLSATRSNPLKLIELRDRLEGLPSGAAHWKEYQSLVVEIITNTLVPPLAMPAQQRRSSDGLEIIDLTLRNDALYGVWQRLDTQFGASIISVEIKNQIMLTMDDLRQLSGYLDPFKGSVGFLIKRGGTTEVELSRCARFLRKGQCILPFSDTDLIGLINCVLKHEPRSEIVAQVRHKVLERI